MPVVSNTSPLLNLAIIGRLSLLHQQFAEVWIPPAVRRELRPEEDVPGSHAVREASALGWQGAPARTGRGGGGSDCFGVAGRGRLAASGRAGRAPSCQIVEPEGHRNTGHPVAGKICGSAGIHERGWSNYSNSPVSGLDPRCSRSFWRRRVKHEQMAWPFPIRI